MSEICFDCWKEISSQKESRYKYIISKELYLCEECGKMQHVIIMARKAYDLHKFRYFILPFKLILAMLIALCMIPFLPYLIYKQIKEKR